MSEYLQPFGRVVYTNGRLGERDGRACVVLVGDEVVARLPITAVSFREEMDGGAKVTLELLAEDVTIQTRAPRP